jgi:hypothetical protein
VEFYLSSILLLDVTIIAHPSRTLYRNSIAGPNHATRSPVDGHLQASTAHLDLPHRYIPATLFFARLFSAW